MNYRSLDDLNRTILKNLYKIPDNIDLIISLSFGGMMLANILAFHLHVPFTYLSRFKQGKIISCGRRMRKNELDIKKSNKILVVNDSLCMDDNIYKIRKEIINLYPDKEFVFATAYSDIETIDDFDIYLEYCPSPQIFEWNIMYHPGMENFCVDIDGVLCYDPLPIDNDDSEKYLQFIENAKPLIRIRKTIGYLVTNRLEKYRTPTVKWLKKNGIEYRELIMQNLPNQQARRQANNYGLFKGEIYKSKKADLFIESSFRQARDIANISGKMVYCVDKRMMIYPHQSFPDQGATMKFIKKCSKRIVKKVNSIYSNKR